MTRRKEPSRYELVWYLSQRPPVAPNLLLLQNALDQTHGAGRTDALAWRTLVRDRLERSDIAAILADVGPFLERPQDAALLTRENLLGLLESANTPPPFP